MAWVSGGSWRRPRRGVAMGWSSGCQDNAVPLFGFCWVGLGKEPSGRHGRGSLGHRTVDCGGA
uniref:Uncharacterized protein n=1 Tax=Oryza sativa subsp. japonica TaxID=39947 RepID=Q6YU40_ORYSJ|nr:hypothetical protein [Oryza sativa Japonica Group]BAD31620.1 hypothetical protein [Oryza sativa Japonica Group]